MSLSPTTAPGRRFDVTFDVTGLAPETQGSTKRVPRKIRGKVVWITTHDNDNLWPWRDLIVVVAKQFRPPAPLSGAVEVIVNFRLAVPKSAPKRRQIPANTTKDVDKLLRALLDGLADAGYFETDGRVTDVTMKKRYAYGGDPGVTVTVRETDGLS